MIVVVGGQSRKVGKTSAVCKIIRATTERQWIAIKISPHPHGTDLTAPVLVEAFAPNETDSGRFFEAGAVRSFWIRSRVDQLDQAVKLLPAGDWIVESNSVVNTVSPDVVVYLTDESIDDSKASGALLARSNVRMTVEEAIDWIRRQPAG